MCIIVDGVGNFAYTNPTAMTLDKQMADIEELFHDTRTYENHSGSGNGPGV